MVSSRRQLCLTLPTLALLAEPACSPEAVPETGSQIAKNTQLLKSNAVFRDAVLPRSNSSSGSTQPVVHGVLPTGEGMELHNTTLLPGHEPHPPHRHPHEEFLLIREGQVDWLVDGMRQTAGAGDILYAASMQMHGIRNIGTTPARYFVVAIGPNLRSAARKP